MKKITLLIAAICFAFAAQAQETYKVMKIHKGDEVTHTIKLSDIDSFTFEQHGPIIIEEISVGDWSESENNFISKAPRSVIIDDNFIFGSGDQVLMSAIVDGSTIYNTFTYDGNKWTQDEPEGSYRSICVQDNPTIESIVSYGGNATAPADKGRNQNSRVSYIAADVLKADVSMGNIEFADRVVFAELAHASADFVVKVRDGEDSANVLDEDTPVLTVTIDEDGLGIGSVTYDYISWNAEKSQDDNGDWYTTFRVILPEGCTILKATLSKVNATAGDATTEIKFFWAASGEPSDSEELKRGTRYSTEYTYNSASSAETVMLK